jgi:hypothetical protein
MHRRPRSTVQVMDGQSWSWEPARFDPRRGGMVPTRSSVGGVPGRAGLPASGEPFNWEPWKARWLREREREDVVRAREVLPEGANDIGARVREEKEHGPSDDEREPVSFGLEKTGEEDEGPEPCYPGLDWGWGGTPPVYSCVECLLLYAWWAPPPVYVDCVARCCGSEYWEEPTDQEEPVFEEAERDECQSPAVAVAPSENLTAEAQDWDIDTNWKLPTLDGTFILAAGLGAGPEYVFTWSNYRDVVVGGVALRVPDIIRDVWTSAAWAFDTPGLYWTYLTNLRKANTDTDTCDSELGFGGFESVSHGEVSGSVQHVVSALLPYVTFERLSSTFREDLDRFEVRIRICAGIMNHFSILFGKPDGSLCTTADLPADAWTSAGAVARGRLASYWLTLLAQANAGMVWEEEGATQQRGMVWPCDPEYHPQAALVEPPSYTQDTDGDGIDEPTVLCFSSSSVFTGPDTEDQMNSLLGYSAWGDVCFFLTRGELFLEGLSGHRGLAERAFEDLFGKEVTVGFEYAFKGNVGDDDPGGGMHRLRRTFRLRKVDLQTNQAVANFVTGLRTTAEGLWLFREHDALRLVSSASAAAVLAVAGELPECPCVPA